MMYETIKNEIIAKIKDFFRRNASIYDVDMAFLYGSWARGYPRKDSDVDIAVVFSKEIGSEDKIFELITDISLKLSEKIRRQVNVIPVYDDFRKPMLYYNAIILGISVFVNETSRYNILKDQAISSMEEFTIFGIRWQLEIARKIIGGLIHA